MHNYEFIYPISINSYIYVYITIYPMHFNQPLGGIKLYLSTQIPMSPTIIQKEARCLTVNMLVFVLDTTQIYTISHNKVFALHVLYSLTQDRPFSFGFIHSSMTRATSEFWSIIFYRICNIYIYSPSMFQSQECRSQLPSHHPNPHRFVWSSAHVISQIFFLILLKVKLKIYNIKIY